MTAAHFALTVYRRDTGEVKSCSHHACAPEFKENVIMTVLEAWGADDHDVIEAVSDPAAHYVTTLEEPVVAAKPALHVTLDKTAIIADGEDIATLTGLPDPCTITIDDDDPLTPTSTVEVSGGGFTFSTEYPGSYSFEVRGRFPFLPFKTVIIAS